MKTKKKILPKSKNDATILEYIILDQLESLDIQSSKMFGGHGLYLDMVFVAIVHNGALFLKTSVHTREKFIEAGMKPFQPSEKQTLKNYYQVPVDILENAEALKEWFLEAKKT